MMLIGALALLGGADATWATTCTDEKLDDLETAALNCPAGEGVYSSVTSTYFQEVLTLAELQAPIGDCDIHDLHAGGVDGGGACTNNFFMQVSHASRGRFCLYMHLLKLYTDDVKCTHGALECTVVLLRSCSCVCVVFTPVASVCVHELSLCCGLFVFSLICCWSLKAAACAG